MSKKGRGKQKVEETTVENNEKTGVEQSVQVGEEELNVRSDLMKKLVFFAGVVLVLYIFKVIFNL